MCCCTRCSRVQAFDWISEGTVMSAPPKEAADRLGLIAKILGIVVAVFSVMFGINQLTGLVAEARQRDHGVADLLAVSAAEQGAARYSAAWGHLEEAAKLVGAPGIIARFVGGSAQAGGRIHVRQEDLAMIWLERVTVSGSQSFTDVVSTVSPTLELGATRAAGARKGDLLAHLGWADFLRWRGGMAEERHHHSPLVRLHVHAQHQDAAPAQRREALQRRGLGNEMETMPAAHLVQIAGQLAPTLRAVDCGNRVPAVGHGEPAHLPRADMP